MKRDAKSTRDTICVNRIGSIQLDSGLILPNAEIAFRSWGSLDADGTNCIVVCHALTGDPNVTQWWPGVVGPGKAIDTDRYFVICLSVPGSPYGSCSPLSRNPISGNRFNATFPDITIRDTIRAHRPVLDQLGVSRVRVAVGASLGGMQALEWGFQLDGTGEAPLVERIIAVACGSCHTPWNIGWSHAQRRAIKSDPNWNGGDYVNRPPHSGLANARMIAMMTYRSSAEFTS